MTGLNTIQLAALDLFANNSFEGVSMSRIAAGSGIKKSTIYAHFTGKEALYLSLFGPCLAREESYLEDTLYEADDILSRLFFYLKSYLERFELKPAHLKFIFRSRYFPPEALKDEVMEIAKKHQERMEKILSLRFTDFERDNLTARDLSKAFLGIIESVELCLFGVPEEAPYRMKSLWRVFREAEKAGERVYPGLRFF
jgi:AcrR family transcriptional regulator